MTTTISIAITMTMIMTTYLILNGFFTLIPQPFYVQGDLDPLVAQFLIDKAKEMLGLRNASAKEHQH